MGDEGCEGRGGGHYDVGSRGAEEEWLLQACWCAEHEVEEEARGCCPQGREPFHEGTLRLQGEASVKDRKGVSDEEAQGDDQLSCSVCDVALRWSEVHAFGGRSHQGSKALYSREALA